MRGSFVNSCSRSLKILVGRISRAKPPKDLNEAAEEEAERTVREEKRHAILGTDMKVV